MASPILSDNPLIIAVKTGSALFIFSLIVFSSITLIIELVVDTAVTVLGASIICPTSPKISPVSRVPNSNPCLDSILTLPLWIKKIYSAGSLWE